MPAKLQLRTDYSSDELRQLARKCTNARQTRRLLAIAAVLDGSKRKDAARIGGMDAQILRDWVIRYNEKGPDALVDRRGGGAKPRLSDEQLKELYELVKAGPDPEKDGIVRWRQIDLKREIKKRFGVDYHKNYIGHILHRQGFSHISSRPQHPAQDPEVLEDFKKNFQENARIALEKVPPGTPIEVWFQDEMRLGQKNPRVRQWAPTGSRPRQPADQRYSSVYISGAICPERGVGAAIVMSEVDTEVTELLLEEISTEVAKGAHALVLMDQASWHTTPALTVPKNVTIMLLPPRSPELNSIEQIWQHLRQTYLSNRVYEDTDALIDAACKAWNRLIDTPDQIETTGTREWAVIGSF